MQNPHDCVTVKAPVVSSAAHFILPKRKKKAEHSQLAGFGNLGPVTRYSSSDNKVLLGRSQTSIYIPSLAASVLQSELSCDRDRVAHGDGNIYSLALCRPSLLAPASDRAQSCVLFLP